MVKRNFDRLEFILKKFLYSLHAVGEKTPLRCLICQRKRSLIFSQCFIVPLKAAQQVGAGSCQRLISGEFALGIQVVNFLERRRRAFTHRQCDRAIKRHYRRWL